MNKEALIKIILSDIAEVETLVKSFQGGQDIPLAFIDLTERKFAHIKDEFSLLKSLTTEHFQPSIKEKEEPITEVIAEEKPRKHTSTNIQEVAEETVNPTPEIIESATQKITNETIEHEIKSEIIEDQNIQTKNLTTEGQSTNIRTSENEKTNEKTEEITKTLGESFVGEKKSVNDRIASSLEPKTKNPFVGKPVSDLTKGLGINDRFMFQRELFDGKSEVMKQTLQQLNEMQNFKSAQSFIASNFNWDDELEVTQSFYNYIKRKY